MANVAESPKIFPAATPLLRWNFWRFVEFLDCGEYTSITRAYSPW